MTRRPTPLRSAFTLVELLTTMTIVGALVAMLLPAVQSAREASRRTVCLNHTRQVALATLNYESSQGELPAVWQSSRRLPWENFSWRTALLPFIERQPMFDNVDLGELPMAPSHQDVVQKPIDLFQCPSAPDTPRQIRQLGAYGLRTRNGLTAAGHDLVAVHGVLMTNSEGYSSVHPCAWSRSSPTPEAIYSIGDVPLTPRMAEERSRSSSLRRVTDGLAKTILLAEQAGKPHGWGSHEAASGPSTIRGRVGHV